jgi:hypothetical protein
MHSFITRNRPNKYITISKYYFENKKTDEYNIILEKAIEDTQV